MKYIRCTHLVNNTWLQVHEDSPRYVLASPGLGEESVEAVICDAQGAVGGHQAVRVDPVLQAVELPDQQKIKQVNMKTPRNFYY